MVPYSREAVLVPASLWGDGAAGVGTQPAEVPGAEPDLHQGPLHGARCPLPLDVATLLHTDLLLAETRIFDLKNKYKIYTSLRSLSLVF